MGLTRQRKPGKQEMIVNILRQRIVSGQLAPGTPLTSRLLQQEFQTGAAIVQAAVHILAADGFLETKHRLSTCVSLTPPHLTNYGVVFYCASPLAYPPNGTFDSVLAHECAALRSNGDVRINLYFGITGHTDDEDYPRLLADVGAQRIAGLLFANMHQHFAVSLFAEQQIPRVKINSEPSTGELASLILDHHAFLVKALDYLADRGRRRIAVVKMLSDNPPTQTLEAMFRERGMVTYPHWTLASTGIPLQMIVPQRQRIPHVTTATYLLLNSVGERPDGMIVLDDIFLASVVDGIIQSGLQIGQQIDLVAHCNYPLSSPDEVPVKRVGFSTREVLQQAIRQINLQRTGSPMPNTVIIPALYQEELEVRQQKATLLTV